MKKFIFNGLVLADWCEVCAGEGVMENGGTCQWCKGAGVRLTREGANLLEFVQQCKDLKYGE